MQRTTDVERGGESVADSPADAKADRRDRSGARGRLGLKRRLGGLFSIKVFLAALVGSILGLFLGGAIPLVGVLGRIAGLFAVGFVVGLVGRRRRYAEVGLAAAAAAALVLVLSALGSFGTVTFPYLVRAYAQYGTAIAGVGAGTGLVVALVGHYFGRDLRAGLMREIN
ncbi:hypothetical protein [Halegenticoccus tardaugens]|uniref:hypothetical protein n=1 Tax=Halegenticoccus tardaugens TaxID=2071624 RepID=UPI00100B9D26|nr:hypothetical protein [Halegenticoccus tardaugens]